MSKRTQNILLAVFGCFMVIALADALVPDERVEYKTKTVTKHVTDTETVTKYTYPEVCFDYAEVVRKLDIEANVLANIPEEQVNQISEIRIATVSRDNDKLVEISEQLQALSDKYDGTVDRIVTLRHDEQRLAAECHTALR